MNKLLVITNCKQCSYCYTNYMPDGKNGKLWCSSINIELNADECENTIHKDCNLNDAPTITDKCPFCHETTDIFQFVLVHNKCRNCKTQWTN